MPGDGHPHPAELSVERERTLPAPPVLVWAVAGDTNRWDRIVGAGASSYASEEVAGEPGRQLVGHADLAGFPSTWLERGEWLEGEFVSGERRYLSGPLAVAGYRVQVSPTDSGTRLSLRAYMRPSMPLPAPLAANLERNMARSADRYLDALAELLTGRDFPEPEPDEPAALYARRALVDLHADPVVDGDTSPVREEALEYCQRKLDDAPIDDDHRRRIVELIRHRPDPDVEQIRPFALARAWGSRRRPLLRSFLHAATCGLLDLRWQLNCPRCRVGAASAPRLDQVGRRGHCDVCDIDFDIDFSDNVEAVFRVNPGIRAVAERIYCTSSPWFRPHVFAVIELAAGETRCIDACFPTAGYLARPLQGPQRAEVPAGAHRLRLANDELIVEPRQQPAAGEHGPLELVNETDRDAVLLLERREADAVTTHGTDILTMPEFVDLYGTEAPASGADLTIGSVTVLFSDLTRTTELYRTVGDARAFSLIQEHFRQMAAVVADAGGAILKTMGDAVMASFASPGDAVRAARHMIEATRQTHGSHGLRLKVGVHAGPCVMVRANQRMDLFGSTVNTAWRLQEQAAADQLVMLPPLLAHPEVAAALSREGLDTVASSADLKGIGEHQEIAVVSVE